MNGVENCMGGRGGNERVLKGARGYLTDPLFRFRVGTTLLTLSGVTGKKYYFKKYDQFQLTTKHFIFDRDKQTKK